MDEHEGSESESDVESDVEAISLREVAAETAADVSAGREALAATEHLAAGANQFVELSALARNDREPFSDLPLRPEDATTADLKLRIERLEAAHSAIGAENSKGPLYTRYKFWAVVLPAVMSTATAVTALVLAYGSQARGTASPDVVPEKLQTLLTDRSRKWSSMAVGDAMGQVRDLVKGYGLSLEAQAFIMVELKRFAPQPAGAPTAWDQAFLEASILTLEEAYGAATAPKSVALYDEVVKLQPPGTPPRALTVHEAADVCDYALCDIIALRSGGTT